MPLRIKYGKTPELNENFSLKTATRRVPTTLAVFLAEFQFNLKKLKKVLEELAGTGDADHGEIVREADQMYSP